MSCTGRLDLFQYLSISILLQTRDHALDPSSFRRA